VGSTEFTTELVIGLTDILLAAILVVNICIWQGWG